MSREARTDLVFVRWRAEPSGEQMPNPLICSSSSGATFEFNLAAAAGALEWKCDAPLTASESDLLSVRELFSIYSLILAHCKDTLFANLVNRI
jgi:hypothetical protein